MLFVFCRKAGNFEMSKDEQVSVVGSEYNHVMYTLDLSLSRILDFSIISLAVANTYTVPFVS
jgi:hypothetical protein